jgi:hypothetical protein
MPRVALEIRQQHAWPSPIDKMAAAVVKSASRERVQVD